MLPPKHSVGPFRYIICTMLTPNMQGGSITCSQILSLAEALCLLNNNVTNSRDKCFSPSPRELGGFTSCQILVMMERLCFLKIVLHDYILYNLSEFYSEFKTSKCSCSFLKGSAPNLRTWWILDPIYFVMNFRKIAAIPYFGPLFSFH